MNLAFSLSFPWRSQTDFVPKIWTSVSDSRILNGHQKLQLLKMVSASEQLTEIQKHYRANKFKPKHHTIRAKRKSNEWSVGRLIHFYINLRNPHSPAAQFLPVIPARRVDRCDIVWPAYSAKSHRAIRPGFIAHPNIWPMIRINNEILQKRFYLTFAENDGFDNLLDFFKFFAGSDLIDGRLIHWSDLNYDRQVEESRTHSPKKLK